MPNTDTTTRHLAQLREDLANARECGNDTVEVPTGALETVLAGLSIVWSPSASEGTFTDRDAAERAAIENDEESWLPQSTDVMWRLAGDWHDADAETGQ